jgi:predicted lipid-binding transport protein (Tim44 family)
MATTPIRSGGSNAAARDLHDRSVGELVHLLTSQVSALARDEVELAKAELARKGKVVGIGGGMIGAAGLVAVLGLGALTAAAILGLAQVIDQAWVAALIVGAAYLAVAGALALVGRRRIQEASPLVPEEATESVKEDVEWLKTRARSART